MDEFGAGNILNRLRTTFQRPEFQKPQTLLEGTPLTSDDQKTIRSAAFLKCYNEIETVFKKQVTPFEAVFIKSRVTAFLDSKRDRLKKMFLSLVSGGPEKNREVIEIGDWVINKKYHLVGQVEKVVPPTTSGNMREFIVRVEESVPTNWISADVVLFCKNRTF